MDETDDDEQFESASEGVGPEDEPTPEIKADITEGEVASTPKVKAPESKPPAPAATKTSEASGWSGWTSFLTSAVSAVQETLKEDIDTLYTSAVNTTSTLSKTLVPSPTDDNPTVAEGEQQPADDSTSAKAEQHSQNDDRKGFVKTDSILHSTETILSTIDKTLDFTSDLLGNAVLGGYRQIEKANLPEKLGNIEKSLKETVMNEKGLTEVLKSGVGALEMIGSVVGTKATAVLAETRLRQRAEASEYDQNSGDGKKSDGSSVKKKRKVNLDDLFEDNCGNAHLQALEMLATESKAQVEAISKDILELVHDDLAKVDELLVDFDYSSIISSVKESLVLQDSERVQQLSNDLGVSNSLANLTDFLQEVSSSLESVEDDKIREECLWKLADMCEIVCEQTLRVAEVILMLIAEENLKRKKNPNVTTDGKEKALKYATNVSELNGILVGEMKLMVELYKDLAEKKKTVDNFAETEEVLQDLNSEFTKGVGFVTSAGEYLGTILRLMVVKCTNAPVITPKDS